MSDAYEIRGTNRTGRWLITCDHATNRVPDDVAGGDLGLPPEEMERHIAYDIGALGLADALAVALDSPVISSTFSRLVIDPNRGPNDPTRVMKLYDGTIIPANGYASESDIAWRVENLYNPYHRALADLAARRQDTVICAVHSFTQQLRGRAPRPWEVGILYADDDRLARPVMSGCEAAGWITGDNEPYAGHLPGDSIDRHALAHGRLNVLIELRQDLIADEAGQKLWARKLAPILTNALAQTGL